MQSFSFKDFEIGIDFESGTVESLFVRGRKRSAGSSCIFRAGLRDREGNLTTVSSKDAILCSPSDNGAVYEGFKGSGIAEKLKVSVSLTNRSGRAAWTVSADILTSDAFIEWIDYPLVSLPRLIEDAPEDGGGSILFPYNEGVLVKSYKDRELSYFGHWPLVYPSYGSLAIFPNMICSQMMAYLWEDAGIYFGAEDPDRGLKGIDYFEEGGVIEPRFRLFSGAGFGESFSPSYPIVWAACGPDWQSAAAIYRDFFEANLPPRAHRISENPNLPGWYKDSPLVVSYPVRGIHDMDKMDPNNYFPYVNALPEIDYISEKTNARLLVLLMHWEGTAPWAPPYVWPPYGGEKPFKEFLGELRKRNMLLGVYCSGFGYTLKSNLVDDFDNFEEFEKEHLIDIMCAGPDGKVLLSNICPGQRSGYDICPATEKGKEVLAKAYTPLFSAGIDYAQILDQNHGGGQYLCYSRDHGHPPAPGPWMTKNMQGLLTSWNKLAGKMILGCESAAAEPFIGNLLLSDNRFELNYFIGTPVPLYAFIYHEYVRNFMGNQVCCPLEESEDTYTYRLGYSFAAGDCMTIVITPDGRIMSSWGNHDFSKLPDKEYVLSFVKNLTAFYKTKASEFLFNGRMTALPDIFCEKVSFGCRFPDGSVKQKELPAVICTAWEGPGNANVIIAVNPLNQEATLFVRGEKHTIPPLDAKLIEFDRLS